MRGIMLAIVAVVALLVVSIDSKAEAQCYGSGCGQAIVVQPFVQSFQQPFVLQQVGGFHQPFRQQVVVQQFARQPQRVVVQRQQFNQRAAVQVNVGGLFGRRTSVRVR